MSNTSVFLASDVHLGAISDGRERAFRRWLSHVGEAGATLVINGDLFDFWFEYRSAVPRGYTRVLGDLAALVDSGQTVHLTGGNHDWWGGSYLENEIGVTFHRSPVELVLAGHRVLLAHGDGLGPGDLGYRVLQHVLRNRLFTTAFRWLHPDVGARIAQGVSSTRARATSGHSGSRSRAAILEDWALQQLDARADLDLITLGHTHQPALKASRSGGWYLNTGDWVEHLTYARLDPAAPPTLLEWFL